METQLLTCGLISAVQTYTAIYYVMADLLMLGMYTYYKVKNKMNQGECAPLFPGVFFFYCSVDANLTESTSLPFIF